ncbi:hypothetical protein RB601_000817 [Gaeumannomyces tritici]
MVGGFSGHNMDTPPGFTTRRPGSTSGLPPLNNLSSTRSPEVPSTQNHSSANASTTPIVSSPASHHQSPATGYMDPQAPFPPAERPGALGAAIGRSVSYGSHPTGPASGLQAPQHLPPVSSVLTPAKGVASEALNPLSSGINSASSQSSQSTSHTAAPPFYQQAGSWPTPGSGSGYTLSSIASQNQSHSQNQNHSQSQTLMQPSSSPYHSGGSRSQNYSPSVPYGNFRTSQHSTGADSVPVPSYSQDQLPPFPSSLGGGGGSSLSGNPPTLPSQQQNSIMGSHTSVSQTLPPPNSSSDRYQQSPYSYPQTSGPPAPSFPSFASHSLSSHPPPTTSAAISRGMTSMGPSGGMMHPHMNYAGPPRAQGPHHPYSQYGMGSVMSNISTPGQPMSMMPTGGMYQMPHHNPHPMYQQHTDPTASRHQDRPFRCDQCNQSFNRNHDLKRHKRIHLAVKPFPCNYCDKSFSRKDALKRHRLVKGCGKTAEDGSTTQVGGESVEPRSDSDGTVPSPPPPPPPPPQGQVE